MDDTLQSSDSGPTDHPLHRIPIEVSVTVGKARPLVRELLDLKENTVLTLDKKIEDPVELYVGDRLIARGELQEIDSGDPGQLAVRLTEVAQEKDGLS